MSEWQDFCEKNLGYITAETNWICNDYDELDDIPLEKWKRKFQEQKRRLLFFNLQDALSFLNQTYIDPLLSDRYIRRHNQYRDFYIVVSRYDREPDEYFSYFIYDQDLQEEYVNYLYGKDEIIYDVSYPISRKLKFINGNIDIKESYIKYFDVKAFEFTSFIESGLCYKQFKLDELSLRRREIELFKKLYNDEIKKFHKPIQWGHHPAPVSYDVLMDLENEIKCKLYIEFRNKYLTQEDKDKKFPKRPKYEQLPIRATK